jgi:hypothetical protein
VTPGIGTIGIGRRVIYSLLILVVLEQVLRPTPLPLFPTPPAKRLHQAIVTAPRDKLVVLSCSWEAGTQGETAPQTDAIIRSLFLTDHKFAIFSMVPQGAKLAGAIADRLAKEYHKVYGVDYVNWGYKFGFENFLIPWAKDIPRLVKTDSNGTPVSRIPLMGNVKTIRDVGLVIDVTGLAGITELWLQFIQGVYKTPFGMAVTGVMGPEAYPYLDSGQLTGLLTGLKGAAEYEQLIGAQGLATRLMAAQSWAHVLIILLIVLGNIGAWRISRARRRSRAD